MADTLHEDEDASIADTFVDVESAEFWRRIRAMSSATFKPTRTSEAFRNFSVELHHGRAEGRAGLTRCGYEDRQGR